MPSAPTSLPTAGDDLNGEASASFQCHACPLAQFGPDFFFQTQQHAARSSQFHQHGLGSLLDPADPGH